MERKKLNFNDDLYSILRKLSEGNQGALNVVMSALEAGTSGFLKILDLDDMNIRGTQIWLGYSDYCYKDKELFWDLVQKRDADLVEAINRENARQGGKYKAIQRGASYKNQEEIVFTKEEMIEFSQKPKMVHPEVENKKTEL